MSILIKGAKMPKECEYCMFAGFGGEENEYYVCMLNGKWKGRNRDGRMESCPLVEIPPHGRLIDADKLEYNSIGCWAPDEVRPPQDDTEWLISKYEIDEEAPTVIESEEQEHGVHET